MADDANDGCAIMNGIASTVANLAAKVRSPTGQDYTVRQAAYDLPKLRGKQLVVKANRNHRYRAARRAPASAGVGIHVHGQLTRPAAGRDSG
jgi:hypothetical protein